MKVETKIIVEKRLLQDLEGYLKVNGRTSLSELIEDLLRAFLVKSKKPSYNHAELDLINKNADELNKEAGDVLNYQIAL